MEAPVAASAGGGLDERAPGGALLRIAGAIAKAGVIAGVAVKRASSRGVSFAADWATAGAGAAAARRQHARVACDVDDAVRCAAPPQRPHVARTCAVRPHSMRGAPEAGPA